MRYVGIDFSGDQGQWGANVQESNIWIAEVEENDRDVTLVNLQRVHKLLPGPRRPFDRLASWLAQGNFLAAAIDAPFSIPWWFFGQRIIHHADLLAAVHSLPLKRSRDFPAGKHFVDLVKDDIPFVFSKPLRATDSYWRGRSVNVRSPVWNGPRPGAPFTSACIKMLAKSGRQAWPWAAPNACPLVEAYPAAQLRHWGLPFQEYNGPAGEVRRTEIIKFLTENCGFRADDHSLAKLTADADALDAVLCTYAARAIVQDSLAVALPPFNVWQREGWIAVHS